MSIEKILALRERELDLLLAIDAVRDTVDDETPPGVMFEQLLALLVAHVQADAAAFVVLADESGEVEYEEVMQLNPGTGMTLCQRVLEAHDQPNVHRVQAGNWSDGIGVRVVLNEMPLGAVVLLRRPSQAPFTDDDLALLKTAERQIDSAIIQVRRIWRLAQRNRELDAIYRLDQLRDEQSDENDLVTAFIQMVREQFDATLCLVILSHIDSGEMVIRGIVDRVGLKPGEFQAIIDTVAMLDTAQALASPRETLSLLGAPFLVAGMQLGAVVIGRETPFLHNDQRILHALSTQMDSAVVYSRVIQQLTQRNRELQIIYNIDKIRDGNHDFDGLLQAVLGELCEAIDSDVGFILLFNEREEDQLEIKSTSKIGAVTSQAYYEAIQQVARQALDEADMVFQNNMGGEVQSVLATPLMLREKVIGVFGGVNSNGSLGFTAENRRMLKAIVSQVDTAVFERMEQRRVRQVLGRSVDPKVLDYMLANTDAATVLAGERMNVSVLFADLRGSTEWAERTGPDALAYILNKYLGCMTDVIFEFGGTLDKFVGDEVIALFGAPLLMTNHAERCATAALHMQATMAELQRELRAEGHELPPMGVGLSTGDAICGEFGTAQRTDYTAMGRMMNLGARLCSTAGGGEVVISEETYRRIEGDARVVRLHDISLKGIGITTAYKLVDLGI